MSLAENRVAVGIGKETTKGTPVAATFFPRWGDGTNFQPSLAGERLREGDGTVSIGRFVKGTQFYKGKVVVARARGVDLGSILKTFCGTTSDAVTGAGDPFTHTFTPQLTRDFYTIWPQYQLATPEALKLVDAVFHSATITGAAGKLLDIEAEYSALSSVDDTTTMTPSYDASTAPYHYVNGTFSVDGTTVGQVAPFVTKFKISYKHPLDESMQTEALALADFVGTTRELDIEYELLFQDFTQFKKVYWNAGTTDSVLTGTGSLDLTFYPGGDTTLVNRTFEIIVPALHYEAAMPPDPKLSGKAFRQTIKAVATVAPEITFKLKNAQATIY